MPTWMVETSLLVYGLVTIAALVLAFLWIKAPEVKEDLPLPTRKGRIRLDEDEEEEDPTPSTGFAPRKYYALALLLVLAFGGTVALMDHLVVTDKEQIIFAVNELAAGTGDHNLDRVFAHVSDSFKWGNLDKNGFRGFADQVVKNYNVSSVKVWDFHDEEISREGKSARISFSAKAKGSGPVGEGAEYYLVVAEFALDPDGKWRLKTFDLHNPFVNTKTPVAIPAP